MAGVAHNTQHEFWQPPAGEGATAVQASYSPVRPAPHEVCSGCETEFMVAAGFCHACGLPRNSSAATSEALPLNNAYQWLKVTFGLSGPSLIAFLVGLLCIAIALIGGAAYSPQSYPDFPAIMLWRMQWLVAAVAAFVAGILLKNPNKS